MKKLTLILLLMLAYAFPAVACTNFIVGKNASTDGSVFVSYSADSYGMFGFLAHYPAGKWDKGTMLPVHEWDTGKYLGEIEQAPVTYNVIGNINEYQLAIAETTFGGRPELVDTTGILDYGSLIYITLQRARTAREAIKVMTDLVKEYGYYSSGESFSIADPNEAWIMEMIGKGPGVKGAVWVAVRIPDDCIAAHANHSRIHRFDLNDKNNCMYSPDVISFAREKGYFSGKNSEFSFSKAYAPADFGAVRYCEARVWSFYNKFVTDAAPYISYIEGESDEPMPLYFKPDRKLSRQDVQDAMRDHFEGTPLDMTKDLGAGPYASPYRFSNLEYEVDGVKYFNERPTSTYQSGFTFVAQMRAELPDAIGGVLWFGLDDANMCVYTPVYCCTDRVPYCYSDRDASYTKFSWDNGFWIYNWVANMVYQRYSLMFPEILKCRQKLEGLFANNQTAIEERAKQLFDTDRDSAKKYLTDYTEAMADVAIDNWKKLGEFLIVKFNDGLILKTDGMEFEVNEYGKLAPFVRVEYTKDYLRQVIKTTGDRYKIPAE